MNTKLVTAIISSIFIIIIICFNIKGYYFGKYTKSELNSISEDVQFSKLPKIKSTDNSLGRLYEAYDLKGGYEEKNNN